MSFVIALVGPTAVGKTAIAIELAAALDAEIVSCDSMQVYRQMPVLSQAPTQAQRRQVPHHLVDCLEPTEDFSVGAYRHAALPVMRRLAAQGKPVVIVGGTGLYLRALTQGLCEAPPADAAIRERLVSECHGFGSEALHHRLQDIDARAASRIHPHDARRIIRALEVHTLTGKPLSHWWTHSAHEPLDLPAAVIGLTRDRDLLYQRINERVIRMLYEEDVVGEVRRLLRLPLSKTARQVHGLPDIERYLQGAVSLKETIAVWQQRVRHYARRQLIWFRAVPDIRWIEVPSEEAPEDTGARVLELARRARPLHPAGTHQRGLVPARSSHGD